MRWPGESPSDDVSPLVNPIRTSLTSGEGDVRITPRMRMHLIDAWIDDARGCSLGRVPKRGSAEGCVMMENELSLGGMCHEPNPSRVSMSLTVRDGTGRFE